MFSGLLAGVTVAGTDMVTVCAMALNAVTNVPAGIAPAVSVSVEPELVLPEDVPATISEGMTVTPVITFEPPVTAPTKGGSPKDVQVGLPIL